MIKHIVKGSIHIARLDTQNGFYSHNLYSAGLGLRIETDAVFFLIDLTKNLKVKNKEQNDYTYVVDFIYYIDQFNEVMFSKNDVKDLSSFAKEINKSVLYVEFQISLNYDIKSFPVTINIDDQYLKLLRLN